MENTLEGTESGEKKPFVSELPFYKSFTRAELQLICDRARFQELQLAQRGGNPMWQKAYFDLAQAADYLDLMMARTEKYG